VPQPQFEPNDPEENPPGDIAPQSPGAGANRQPVRPGFPPNGVRPNVPTIVTGPGVIPSPVQPPFDQPQPDPPGADDDPTSQDTGNPFGVPAGSSSTPGVIAPVPQQQPQARPRSIQEPD
jgi:hypothetical protein